MAGAMTTASITPEQIRREAHERELLETSGSQRVFAIAFGVSLGVHLAFLIGQFFQIAWLRVPTSSTPLNVVYKTLAVQEELQVLQEQLTRAKRETMATPGASARLGERPQIRIPDRPALISEMQAESMADQAAVADMANFVDLTNLAEAARGDPVLLSYFGAIREQIQRTANRQDWTMGQDQGLVYISFVLTPDGQVSDLRIVRERSANSAALHDVAMRIVNAAAPFPAFPPSLQGGHKTIVVPLEFLLGGAG
jgi:TonB family protein